MGDCALVVLLLMLLENMGIMGMQMGREVRYLGMFLRVSYRGGSLKMSNKIVVKL